MTPLMQAYLRMQAFPGEERARMSYFARLADARLFIPLEDASDGQRISPLLADVDGVTCVQVSEDVAQLASDVPTHNAEVEGRDLAQMLSGSGLGLAVNGAQGHILLPEMVEWFAEALASQRVEAAEAPVAVYPHVSGMSFWHVCPKSWRRRQGWQRQGGWWRQNMPTARAGRL